MIAGENLYAGDYVCMNRRDGLLYQATWEEFKICKAWRISLDVRKGEPIPEVSDIIFSRNAPVNNPDVRSGRR
ncbi:MAG TPA: hypothetical protein VHO84_08425 [Syntrophorhabdaceae bacterium]|nr:hypothetical protein [Syntrophorhabdaceae bacterium]